ncbi:MAG TPA: hypothetical protein DIU00_16020 [Phycisphaerales bacterium]|nr:hypothetical protein [Phycisphaerales bacterium]
MKPTEKIEESVKLEKPHVNTGGAMDKRTLNDSFAAMDDTIRANKTNAAGILLRSRAARLTAAAVILVAIGLLMVYRNPPVQPPPETVSVAKSPAEMLTAKSLMIAYRHGGIEAIERQCDKALEMQGPQMDILNVKELFTEIEIDLERTEL